MIEHYDSGLVTGWLDQQRVNMRVSCIHKFARVVIANKQTYLFCTQCAIHVQFSIVREIYKMIREWVQNE